MSSRRLRAYGLLLVASIIWGVATVVIKYTLSEISPYNFLTYRFALSAIVAIILLGWGKYKLPNKTKDLWMVILTGLSGNTLALGLLFVALTKTTAMDSAILDSIIPLLVAVLGVIFFHDRITRREKLGSLVAFVGTLIVVVGPLIDAGGGNDGQRFMGNILVILFVLADSVSFILAKKLTRDGVSASTISNLGFIVAFGSMLPISLATSGWEEFVAEIVNLPLGHHLGVWFMALASGSLAYWLWTKGQQTIEVSEAAVFRYLIPIFATPLAIAWLKESITYHFILGSIVIFVGVGLAEAKKTKATKKLEKRV